MKKWAFALAIIFLFSINSVQAVEVYKETTYKHWAVPYADNLSQRLMPVKKAVEESGESSDISARDIDMISREILEPERFNEYITFNNWQKMLTIILGEQMAETYSNKGNIRREDAVAGIMQILSKKFNLAPSDLNALEGRDKFQDGLQTGQDKIALIGLASSQGIISGYNDASFRPKDNLKNSEAITIIERICSKYGLPEKQWNGNIELLSIDGFLHIDGPQAIEEAFWTNDKGILLVYSTENSNVRKAAKVFVNESRAVKAFEYDNSNLKESLFNESAFREERGYLSANNIIWNKNRRYVNIKGELKSIDIPYVNYSVSGDNRMVLIQDEEEHIVRTYDFLTERSVILPEYFRWADEQYTRGIKWSPDSRYIISTLFKPEDDIGIEEKSRFAVFDCRDGKLLKVVGEQGYYSYYPTWSADGSKIAFYRVKADDKEIESFLNNEVDSQFNLLAREIGVYDISTGEIKYYPHPQGVILGKYQNGLVWSPQGNVLYTQIAADKEMLLHQISQGGGIDIERITNEVWKLDISAGTYTKILAADESIMEQDEEDDDISVFSPVGTDIEVDVEEDVYTVEANVKSVSPDGKRILYVKQPYNLTRYENIPTEYVLKNMENGEEKDINNMLLTDHWWLTDSSLLIVESAPIRSRYAQQTTYMIKRIKQDFGEIELARLSQYPTVITLSPDKNFLMLHQYRGNKDVKIIDLREQL